MKAIKTRAGGRYAMQERAGEPAHRDPEPEPYQPETQAREPIWKRLGFESQEQACALLWATLHPALVVERDTYVSH